jgi:hypothetical protein
LQVVSEEEEDEEEVSSSVEFAVEERQGKRRRRARGAKQSEPRLMREPPPGEVLMSDSQEEVESQSQTQKFRPSSADALRRVAPPPARPAVFPTEAAPPARPQNAASTQPVWLALLRRSLLSCLHCALLRFTASCVFAQKRQSGSTAKW